MSTKQEILNEIQELMPSLAEQNKQLAYVVPENYFENLPERILITAKGLVNPYHVSESYFETLSDKILQRVQAPTEQSVPEELQEIAPVLATVSKHNPYSIPKNYFQSIQFNAPQTKVVRMQFTRRIINYAAAAVMAGVLITGAFVYNAKKTSFDLSKEAKYYSDEELNTFLNNTQTSAATEYSMNQLTEPVSLKENLQFYSEEELKEYLNENEHSEKMISDINEGGS